MCILGLESSLNFCSLAVLTQNQVVEHHAPAPLRHNEVLLPQLNELLARAEIKLSDVRKVAYGRGPGSFTGVRVAAATAQAIALARNLPIYALSSLAALALSAQPDTKVLTLLDARLGELYWAAWLRHRTGVTELAKEAVASAAEIVHWLDNYPATNWLVLGEGGKLLQDVWPQLAQQEQDFHRVPRARDLLALIPSRAPGIPETELPIYLRAEKPWRKS